MMLLLNIPLSVPHIQILEDLYILLHLHFACRLESYPPSGVTVIMLPVCVI